MRMFMLLELALALFLIYTIISQILIPAFRGTRIFPFFRKEQKLRDEMVDLNQQQQEAELADALEQRRREHYGTSTKADTDAAQALDAAVHNAKNFAETQPPKEAK